MADAFCKRISLSSSTAGNELLHHLVCSMLALPTTAIGAVHEINHWGSGNNLFNGYYPSEDLFDSIFRFGSWTQEARQHSGKGSSIIKSPIEDDDNWRNEMK